MPQYLRITCGLLFGFAVGGYPSAQKPEQPTPPENLGIVINKFCNGLNENTAAGDTVELLVLQKALDARGIMLKDFSPKTGIEDYDNGGGFVFRDDAEVWANIKAGTFIVLSWSNNPVQKFGDTLITAGLLNEEAFRAVGTGKNNSSILPNMMLSCSSIKARRLLKRRVVFMRSRLA